MEVCREILYLLRIAGWPIILMTGVWRYDGGVFLTMYLMADIVRGPLGGVLAWGRYSIDPVHSVLWTLVNVAGLVLGFAALYLHCDYLRCDCFNVRLRGLTHAVYFSAVTAATVGFGDTYPMAVAGQRLVVAQIGLSCLFAVFVLSGLLGQLPRATRTP